MKESLIKGTSFGLTSGIITTLGLMVGLYAGTHSKSVVIGGVITIAIADAFSDALGIHVSEEAEKKHTEKEIWASTLSTLFSKFFFAIMFVIPLLLLELKSAIYVSVIFGLTILSILSYYIAEEKPFKVIIEHLSIAILVIVITNLVGNFVNYYF